MRKGKVSLRDRVVVWVGKVASLALLFLLFLIVALAAPSLFPGLPAGQAGSVADVLPNGWPTDAQSTTGPVPPTGIELGMLAPKAEAVLLDVPAYIWHNGCGPTAAGMVIGYWDGNGFDNLVSGSADTQTPEVDSMMSSSANYDDYCLPIDSPPNMLPDKSEPPGGDEHTDDCVADLMKTSQSYYFNYYGWSWFSHVDDALQGYVQMVAPGYSATASNQTWGTFTWNSYKAEIDAGRPVVLLVDTNADGSTNHFVTAIGYSDEGGTNMYACRNTWDTGVHWFEFAPMAIGQPWGVYGATLFLMTADECHVRINDDPTDYTTVQAAVDAANDGDVVKVAGHCSGVKARAGVTQVAYISKTITLRGGYTTTNWDSSDPDANPSTLDAQGQGRVLYISGDPSAGSGQAINPTVEGLRITGGDAAGLGGGLYGRDAGGGVYVISARATIRDCQVFGNTAEWYGGGLYLYESDATLSDNTVTANSVTDGTGGGLSLVYSDATLSGNTVSANTVTNGTGGGLSLIYSDATLSNNTVSGNGTYWYGGGLLLRYSAATLEGNIISGNNADEGGGLYLESSDAMLINNAIVSNHAGNTGGGVCVKGSRPRFFHTTIARNSSGDGSGIYVSELSDYSTVALSNTTLASHSVGIRVATGNTVTANGVLWYDTPITISQEAGATVTVQNQHQGDPAIAADGYHLLLGSAAIDKGVNAGVMSDIDGEPRPQGTGYDLGADEYDMPTPTPTPTATPTPTNTPTPTATPTNTPTNTPTPTATPTNTPTPTATPTATPTNTPTSAPPGLIYLPILAKAWPPTPESCVECIANDGFEYDGYWEILSTAYPAGYTTAAAHSGNRSMRLGIVEPAHNVYSYSSIRQAVTIPADATSATLSFWLYSISGEPAGLSLPARPLASALEEVTLAGDAQYVLVLDQYDQWIGTLLWQRSDDRLWTLYHFDLMAFAGQTIKLQFGVSNDGWGGVTAMYLDDVSLECCFVTPPTPAGFGYGIQVHMIGQDHAQIINAVRDMGLGWIKHQIAWKDFEPSKGNINWGDIDALVNSCHDAGLNVLLSVVKAPAWARGANADLTVNGPPADPQDLADFMGAMAGRYEGRVQAYEVWNEQNLHYEWGNEALDANRYVQLLAAAYQAIKAQDPEATVISGAPTPCGDNLPLAVDDLAYLERMYQAGLKNYCDAVGVHPSGYNVPPDADWRTWYDPDAIFRGPSDNHHHSWVFRGTMEGSRDVMVRYGDSGKQLWPTEFGWASVDGLGVSPATGYEYAADNTAEEQAQYIVKAYEMGRSWGWVGVMFLWNLNFGPVAGAEDEKAAFSILYPNWAPRPAYLAVRNMPK